MKVRCDMVSCFVARRAGKTHELLQLRRIASDYMGGTWQIIRGGVHADETAPQAALRELREEAGLTPIEFYRLSALESFYIPAGDTVWHCPAFCAMVSPDAKVVLNDEHDAARWVARADIERHTMWESERLALHDLMRNILDDGPGKPYLRLDVSQIAG